MGFFVSYNVKKDPGIPEIPERPPLEMPAAGLRPDPKVFVLFGFLYGRISRVESLLAKQVIRVRVPATVPIWR